MLQKAGNKGVGQGGELLFPLLVKKDIFSVPEQGHVDVHAGACQPEQRLGHEGGVESVLLGKALHRQLEGHNLVRTVQGFIVLEVDLMLALGALMVAGLDLKAHLFQIQADLPAGALTVVQGAQIEVARLVPGEGGGVALVVSLKEEELQLRPDVEGIKAHVPAALEHPAEHPAGVAHKGGSVRVIHVADQPGNLAVHGPPGEDPEGLQVGIEVLIRLVNTDKAFNGGAVEHTLVVYSLLDLGGGDGHVLQLSEDVHKLHPNEFDVLLLHDADNVFLSIAHGVSAPFSPPQGRKMFG